MRQFIYQESKKGCALACLRMAMIEATGDKNYKYMRLDTHPPYNLKELQEFIAKEGGKLTFSKANSKECIYEALSFPCLLLLKEGENDHMVYSPKRNKKQFLIYDPESGPSWIDIETIKEKWTLVSGTIEIFNRKKAPYKKPKIRQGKAVLIPILMNLLSCVALFGSFYFMQNDSNYLISIGLLALYGIFEVLTRSLTIHSMRKFDDRWIQKIPQNRKYLRERYSHYCALKKVLYSDTLTLVSSLIFALATVILFSINNVIFLIPSAALFLYLFLSTILSEKKIKLNKDELEKAESELLDGKKDEKSVLNALKSINNESYRLGKIMNYEKIIYLLVVIMLALMPLSNAENITLNYYLLHLGGLYAIGQAFKKMFEHLLAKEENEREKLYFYEYFYNE